MGRGTRRWRGTDVAAAGAALAVTIGACGPAATSARPTDPHEIVAEAVRATAQLPSGRLHAEIVLTINGANFGRTGVLTSSTAIDADVDFAGRQLAGRGTSHVTGGIDDVGPQSDETSDVILTSTALFTRSGGQPKWFKSEAGLNGVPTNAVIASTLLTILNDARVTYEKLDAVECTLGQCDHVLVHLKGAAVMDAIAPLLGVPPDAGAMNAVPDFDLDVRISQARSVISELRMSTGPAGQTTQVLVTLSNPGDPVQIVAPAPGLIDDNTGGFGPVETVLETVGSEVNPAGSEPADPLSPAP